MPARRVIVATASTAVVMFAITVIGSVTSDLSGAALSSAAVVSVSQHGTIQTAATTEGVNDTPWS